jgi:hypothetical protein
MCPVLIRLFVFVLVTPLLLGAGEGAEVGEELREADGCGLSALDFGVGGGAEGGDGERHGDAVVGAGVDLGPVEGLGAGYFEAVGIFGEDGAHRAEIAGDQVDAVGFLDAEFLGVADDEAVRGVGGDGGEHG